MKLKHYSSLFVILSIMLSACNVQKVSQTPAEPTSEQLDKQHIKQNARQTTERDLEQGVEQNTEQNTEQNAEQIVNLEYSTEGLMREAEIWKTDPFLKSYAQAMLNEGRAIAADGAMGPNRQQPEQVRVNAQRDGFDAIAFGIAVNDRAVIRQGILAFSWAFDRQSADGNFGASQYPDVMSFLGAYAHALLLLQDAGLESEADQLSRYLPQMKRYLDRPDFAAMETAWENEEAHDPLTNQLFWAGLSYYLIHQVQNNSALEAKAHALIQQGLQRQRSDGSFPERGGSDTSYQGVSLQMLSVYVLYAPEVQNELQPYLEKGFNWLSNKILPDGTIDVSDNTRTRGDQETNFAKKFKQGRLGDPLLYIYWSYLSGDQSARQTAAQIYDARF